MPQQQLLDLRRLPSPDAAAPPDPTPAARPPQELDRLLRRCSPLRIRSNMPVLKDRSVLAGSAAATPAAARSYFAVFRRSDGGVSTQPAAKLRDFFTWILMKCTVGATQARATYEPTRLKCVYWVRGRGTRVTRVTQCWRPGALSLSPEVVPHFGHLMPWPSCRRRPQPRPRPRPWPWPS